MHAHYLPGIEEGMGVADTVRSSTLVTVRTGGVSVTVTVVVEISASGQERKEFEGSCLGVYMFWSHAY